MSTKKIPSFSGTENYQQYKRDVLLWNRVTDIPEEKRGASLALQCTGRAREIVDTLDIEVLFNIESTRTKSGVKVILELFDEHFVTSEIDIVFDRLCEFLELKRENFGSMADYISRFLNLSTQLKSDGVTISDTVVYAGH